MRNSDHQYSMAIAFAIILGGTLIGFFLLTLLF
jgi:hypothetical protein